MSERQVNALLAICDAICESVKLSPRGAPAGVLYAAMMAQGCSLNQFEQIMAGLVGTGKLTKQGDLYFA